MIPGMPALPSVTGGPATSTSGDTGAQRSGDVGGITSPIVIGGFKSDGTAAVGAVPGWLPWAAGAVVVLVIGYFFLKK